MPYMEALVLESVRVFMGRTFSIPHRALRDCTLQGYYIPKVIRESRRLKLLPIRKILATYHVSHAQDTMVIANFNGVLMDEEFWKDPQEFRPDRFLDADGKLNVPDQYLPFGFGIDFATR